MEFSIGWMQSNSPHNKIFCVPLPGDKQPLYNLDLLLRSETETVILTDSVELADSNQPNAPSGVVFTNFLCLPGRYEQVDWFPLQGKEVWYLVVNHSGISLETAYKKAQELSAFLKAQPYEIKLKFIQVKVDYPPCYFQSLETIQKIYSEHPPQVDPDSVMLIENDAEFDMQYQRAQKLIQAQTGWHKAHAEVGFEGKCVAQKENNKRQRPAYLLRPFLLRGEASMLYASKSTGKSALAFSMAAAVVAAGKPLFCEKWWTVPVRENHALNKVLYLDFENGREEIEQRKIDFAYPYWPQDKAKREQCEANLIIEDMSSNPSGKDYSRSENRQDIIELINAAKNKGQKGQPVDLLVIDTVSKFTRKSYTASFNLSDFINTVRKLNIAILLLHHEGSNGEVRGWKCGLDDVYFNLRLYREQDQEEKDSSPVGKFTVKTLEEPLILAYQNARSSIENIPTFEIRFDKKWVEYYREDTPDFSKSSEERRQEEFNRIVQYYLGKRLENKDIYPMLGISKDTYYKLKK